MQKGNSIVYALCKLEQEIASVEARDCETVGEALEFLKYVGLEIKEINAALEKLSADIRYARNQIGGD